MMSKILYPDYLYKKKDNVYLERFKRQRDIEQQAAGRYFFSLLGLVSVVHFFLIEFRLEQDWTIWAAYRFSVAALCAGCFYTLRKIKVSNIYTIILVALVSVYQTQWQAYSMLLQPKISQFFLIVVPLICVGVVQSNALVCLLLYAFIQISLVPLLVVVYEAGRLEPGLHLSSLVVAAGTIVLLKSNLKDKIDSFMNNIRYIESQKEIANNLNNATIGMMAVGIAHEFGNLVASAHSSYMAVCARIKKRGLQDEKLEASLAVLEHSINLSERVIKSINAATRASKSSTTVNIADTIGSTLDLLRGLTLEKIEVRKSGGKDIKIFHNEQVIYQSLINVVRNACFELNKKKGGGTIDIGWEKKGRTVSIRVSDSGGGIADAHKEKIFESGFTSKGRLGMGIGLHFTRKILRENRGDIAVESLKDPTTFLITLEE